MLVTLGLEEVIEEIQPAEDAHEPVQPLEVILVQDGTRQPWFVAEFPGDLIDKRHEHQAHVVSHGPRGPRKCCGHGLMLCGPL